MNKFTHTSDLTDPCSSLSSLTDQSTLKLNLKAILKLNKATDLTTDLKLVKMVRLRQILK